MTSVLPSPRGDAGSLHVEQRGAGLPIVVFESGMGMSGNGWGLVAPEVAHHTRTVVYDRRGLGGSPPGTGARDLRALVDDLLTLLDRLGEAPLLLVGHSWGGPIVRCAAARLPSRVRGLVLVDPTDERSPIYFTRAQRVGMALTLPWLPLLASTGALGWALRRQAEAVPEPLRSALRKDAHRQAGKTYVAEFSSLLEDLQRLREAPPRLPGIPMTWISGAQAGPSELRRHREALIEAHRESAAAAIRGRHVLAPRSGHEVPFTEPGLVAEEILRLVREVRGA